MSSHDDLPFMHAPQVFPASSRPHSIQAELLRTRSVFRGVVNHAAAMRRLGVDINSTVEALSAKGLSTIGYDEYRETLELCPPEVRTMLTATIFASLPRDADGRVLVAALVQYLKSRMALRGLYARLMVYDSDHDGSLTEAELLVVT